ncbi:MAG: hypothetical protein M1592_00695 [Candidatus Thermoplasmatota archaeon]|nr:hypothetical protein [Candidatus Thermoplasmatota archaeon]MCL5881089.1 hypothetical protein [Candidatus Thermoplasmatota archaeon]
MQTKSVALLLVGILLISSVFVFFNVDYPSQPATLILHPPKNVKPPPEIIFSRQGFNAPKLGQNVTTFSPTGNATVDMVGYAYGSSPTGKTPLADKKIYVAVMEVIVSTQTNSSGFYSIGVMKSGSGIFAFKAFQFRATYVDVFVPSSGTYWVNVTLPQSQKYEVAGNTTSTNGTVGDVLVNLKGYYGQYSFTSASSGFFNQYIVNGTYELSAIKPGFSNVTVPGSVSVSGSSIKNETIFLHPLTTAIYRITGYVRNDLGHGIVNATVNSTTLVISVKTGLDGYYSIPATYGYNNLRFSGYQYVTASAGVTATNNTTYNQTMESKNPFYATLPLQSLNIPYSPVSMGDNLSKVNYTATLVFPQPAQVMDGYMQSNQTGQKLADVNFTAYTSVNGTYSYYEFSTNAEGYFSVNFSYTGSYRLVIESSRFPEFNMSSSQNQGGTFQVNASSGIFSVNGSVGNPLTGNGVSGVSIGIGVSSGSSPVINLSSNSTGNFSGKLLGGTYYVHFSKPGYLNRTVEINLTGNTTIPRVNLTPADIGSGFVYWSASSGTGLPGISSANVTSEINASSPSQAVSYSDTPVNFTLHIVNRTGNVLSNVPVEVYAEANGAYFLTKGTTDASGNITVHLSFSGKYVFLPEMIQFSGQSRLVSTSMGSATFNMTNLTLVQMRFNLTNPLNYSGDSVPLSHLTVGNYALPIYPRSPYSSNTTGQNYSIATFYLPAGRYNVSYLDRSYVPEYWNITLQSPMANSTILKPYVLEISWESPAGWRYIISNTTSQVNSTSVSSGTGNAIIPLYYATFSFAAYVSDNIVNRSSFSLNNTVYIWKESFKVSGGSLELNTTNWTYKSGSENFYANYLWNQTSGVLVTNITENATTTSTVNVSIDGSQITGLQVYGKTINLTNYFAISKSGNSTLYIDFSNYTFSDDKTISEYANVWMGYYSTELKGA